PVVARAGRNTHRADTAARAGVDDDRDVHRRRRARLAHCAPAERCDECARDARDERRRVPRSRHVRRPRVPRTNAAPTATRRTTSGAVDDPVRGNSLAVGVTGAPGSETTTGGEVVLVVEPETATVVVVVVAGGAQGVGTPALTDPAVTGSATSASEGVACTVA